MTKVEMEVIEKIWDIAKISPEHGNALMDILGRDKYEMISILRYQKIVKERFIKSINKAFEKGTI